MFTSRFLQFISSNRGLLSDVQMPQVALTQRNKLLIAVPVLMVIVLFSAVTPKSVASDSPNQNARFSARIIVPLLYVGLAPLPQNPLTRLVNTWYTNLDINISVTFLNAGNQTPIEGGLRLTVSAPSKAWTSWEDYLIPQLGLGQSYASFLLFTPREDGLYTISVDSTHTSIAATIHGGFLPLNVSPSSAYTTLVVEVAGVVVAALGVVVGVIAALSRGRGGGGRGRR
jgi:hypothetical protein